MVELYARISRFISQSFIPKHMYENTVRYYEQLGSEAFLGSDLDLLRKFASGILTFYRNFCKDKRAVENSGNKKQWGLFLQLVELCQMI